MYHKEPWLMLTFCFRVILIHLQMLVDVMCTYHTWYWPWFSCTAGWGRQMYINHFTTDRPLTKSALLRYASTPDIDRSLSWNVKQIIYYEEYPSSEGSWLCKMTLSINLPVGSPEVGRFPLYRSMQDSQLCVHTGCELSTHSLGCGQHSASFLNVLQLSSCSTCSALTHSCSPVCVGLVTLHGVYPSLVPMPEVLCSQRVACTPSIPPVFLEMLEIEMIFFTYNGVAS